MSWALILTLALAVEDPRIDLVRLQLENQPREALERSNVLLEQSPETARPLGLDYLRGHLLTELGQPEAAGRAFNRSLDENAELAAYSRYRLALVQNQLNHPEVAAGLVADLLKDNATPNALVPRAIALLRQTLTQGGDCRLLGGIDPGQFSTPERRQLTLSRALCDFRSKNASRGRESLLALLEEDRSDEAAREAVEWVAAMPGDDNDVKVKLLVGTTLHELRDFQSSVRILEMALMSDELRGRRLSTSQKLDARYAMARGYFWLGDYPKAARLFTDLATHNQLPERRARALYQAGRSLELAGRWGDASKTFQQAFNVDNGGRWADAALFSALRLEWRTGNEAGGLELYRLLASKRQWRSIAGRAALFLASSDLVQRRADRASDWLDLALASGSSDASEIGYWRGRLLELEGDPGGAVESYLGSLRRNSAHPMAQAARGRLATPPLAPKALELGQRLAATGERSENLYGAWLLLGGDQPAGEMARRKLLAVLVRDRAAAPYLQLRPVEVESWPLWSGTLRHPEDRLLALGLWSEGAPAVKRHFPLSNLNLAFTSSLQLSRAGEHTHSLRIAEILNQGVPSQLHHEMLPTTFQQLLYPAAYNQVLSEQTSRFGVPPALLQAIIREESRYNPNALSGASARGLTQFVLPTARKFGFRVGLGPVKAADLYQPDIAITLGAAYLGDLLREFNALLPAAVASYNAGEPQAHLWRAYCFTNEPEEYFSKVGFKETRDYVRKVLSSYHRYQQTYGPREAQQMELTTTMRRPLR